MDAPSQITVGHRIYQLTISRQGWQALRSRQASAHELLGQCDNERLIININPDQHPSQMRETVLHECLHAMWDIAGSRDELAPLHGEAPEDHEERLVLKQCPRLFELLRDNPLLVAWLQAE